MVFLVNIYTKIEVRRFTKATLQAQTPFYTLLCALEDHSRWHPSLCSLCGSLLDLVNRIWSWRVGVERIRICFGCGSSTRAVAPSFPNYYSCYEALSAAPALHTLCPFNLGFLLSLVSGTISFPYRPFNLAYVIIKVSILGSFVILAIWCALSFLLGPWLILLCN